MNSVHRLKELIKGTKFLEEAIDNKFPAMKFFNVIPFHKKDNDRARLLSIIINNAVKNEFLSFIEEETCNTLQSNQRLQSNKTRQGCGGSCTKASCSPARKAGRTKKSKTSRA